MSAMIAVVWICREILSVCRLIGNYEETVVGCKFNWELSAISLNTKSCVAHELSHRGMSHDDDYT